MEKTTYKNIRNLILKNRNGGKVTEKTIYIQYLRREYNFGTISGKDVIFTEDDIAILIEEVKKIKILGRSLHLLLDDYPDEKGRLDNALEFRNEKKNSYPVTKDYVLINSINTLKINSEETVMNLFPSMSLGLNINANNISSIEHDCIIFVENLEIMGVISELKIPPKLKDALWLYRGDIKKANQTGKAYEFFRSLKNTKHQLIYFGDIDPKGIEIALTSGAEYWLTAKDPSILDMELEGAEIKWSMQGKAQTYLNNTEKVPEKCYQIFESMKLKRKTIQQEHLYKHKIDLDIYPLFINT